MANIEIPDEAKRAQSVVEGVLGDSIIGIYLFGSAVVGGVKRDSDVAMLVAVSDPPTFEQRKALVSQLMSVSGAIGNPQAIRPLELTVMTVSDIVPWQFPPRAEFVYGEWLREEFEAGNVPEPIRDPDLAVVLKKVIDNSLPLYGSSAEQVFEPVPMTDIRRAIRDSLPGLLAEAAGDERNVVLTLSRISGIFRHGSKKRFGHAIRHASIAAMSLPPSQYRENLRLAGSTLSTMPKSSRGKILPFAAAVAMRARGKSL